MFRVATLLTAAAMLAGCQTAAPVFKRMDGRSAASSPALEAQAKQDMAICRGEVSKALLSATEAANSQLVMNAYAGCMAARGYIKAPEGTKANVTL